MNFDYSEEQQLLADSVRRFLANDYDFEARRRILASDEGWSPEAWATLSSLGVIGLPVSTDHGGFGGGAVDLMGVMEAFGEALVLEPFLPTAMAARLVAGSEAGASVLPAVVEGKMRLAFAHVSQGKTQARRSGEGWVLEGVKRAVLGAPMADRLVVGAHADDGIALFLTQGTSGRVHRRIDGMAVADVELRGAAAERLDGGLARIDEVIDFATALVCAEAVGAMKSACEATLEYLKTRKQFGVPIGTFQALQHRMVDMYIAQEQARSMACLACSKVDSNKDAKERARAVSAAKIKIADSARHISQESVQLHGGMGMSEELKISHTFRRLTLIAGEFGDADHHLARFASL